MRVHETTTSAVDLYLAGRECLLQFDIEGYLEAVPLFLQALEAGPDDPIVRGALAETYSYWGSRRERSGLESASYYELAFEEARRAVALAPESAEAHRAMAVALRAGAFADRDARVVEAVKACDLNPYDGENCCELWRATGRDPDDPLIAKALGLMPCLCSAHIDLGAALWERERLDESAFHLRRALEINPRNSLALYDLAMVELRQGRASQAEETLRRAAAMHGDDPLIHGGLAYARAEKEAPIAAAR